MDNKNLDMDIDKINIQNLKHLAKQGNVNAMFNLATRYDFGWGVKVDEEKAFEWYNKAHENDHPDAEERLEEWFEEILEDDEKKLERYEDTLEAQKENTLEWYEEYGYGY